MDIEEFRDYCLSKPFSTECTPFDEVTLVFKVADKMFALLSLDDQSVNLKCDLELAIALREKHSEVKPGYHMNKKYWNTVSLKGNLKSTTIKEWIDHSFIQVVNGMSKKQQAEILR